MSNRQILEYLLLGSTAICMLLLLIGFYKPWVVLWWEDIQHRKKVLTYYGIAGILFFLGYLVVHKINF